MAVAAGALLHPRRPLLPQQVTLAARSEAICYVDPQRQLRRAGRVGDVQYGPVFRRTGEVNVKQILLRDTSVSICALRWDGGLRCMGVNFRGELANGLTPLPSVTNQFRPWGDARRRYMHIASFQGTQICARDARGGIWCSGEFTPPGGGETVQELAPVQVGTGSTVWVDGRNVRIDDPDVFRAQGNLAISQVTAAGARDQFQVLGVPGQVVDSLASGFTLCWLDTSGRVFCRSRPDNSVPNPPVTELFAQGPVVAISGRDAGTLCAAFADGSIRCRGRTPFGDFASETMVAHAARCPPSARAPEPPPLDQVVAKKAQKLDWRHSIIDLMKAIDLDSRFGARKDLKYSGSKVPPELTG